mgnify:CR=1 FL=1
MLSYCRFDLGNIHTPVHVDRTSGKTLISPYASFRRYSRENVTEVPQELPAVLPCQVDVSFDNPQYGPSHPSKKTRLEPDSIAAWPTSSFKKKERASGFVKFLDEASMNAMLKQVERRTVNAWPHHTRKRTKMGCRSGCVSKHLQRYCAKTALAGCNWRAE